MSSWDDDDDEQTTGSDLESFAGPDNEISPPTRTDAQGSAGQHHIAPAEAGGSLKRSANSDDESEPPNRTRQRSGSNDAVLRYHQEMSLFGRGGPQRMPISAALQHSGVAEPTIPSHSNALQIGFGPSQQLGDYSHHLSDNAISALMARGYPPSMLGPEGVRQNPNPLGMMGIADACLLREQNARNQQTALLLSQLGSLQGDAALSLSGSHVQGVTPNSLHQAMMQNQLQMSMQQQIPSFLQQQQQQQQLQQLALQQQSLSLDPGRFLGQNNALDIRTAELASLLRHSRGNEADALQQQRPLVEPTRSAEPSVSTTVVNQQQHNSPIQQPSSALPGKCVDLPPTFHGALMHWSSREFFPLGVDEDANWLSEFHCFVRSELVEVFRASEEDVQMRNGSIAHLQIGMRCRYCAHQKAANRAGRSSAFPSSLRQIYQSFTMMLRDHFGDCNSIPSPLLDRFVMLKDKPAQGATDSKRYWIYSAMKVGMTDSSDGIQISEESRASGNATAPFGSNPNKRWDDDSYSSIALVLPSDRPLITEFLYLLMRQVQPIRLLESECIGNRRSLQVGLPGFGCRFCCQQRRLGLCRMFPARRRTLPGKIADVHDHIRRCALTPSDVKQQLVQFHNQKPGEDFYADHGSYKEFFDRVWSRLGHDRQSA